MSKVIAMTSVSLDGFMEGPDRQIDWHRVDDELHDHFNDFLAAVGAFLEGRRSHDLMVSVWPTADADPASGRPQRRFAEIWRAKPKYVFSRTRQSDEWATVVPEVDAESIGRIKSEVDGDLIVGGSTLIAAFRDRDLIDEYRVYVHPVVVGAGHSTFAPGRYAPSDLRLLDTHVFGNGVVLLHHTRTR